MSDRTYGLLQNQDVDVLEGSLFCLKVRGTVRILEIGTYDGRTANGMKAFLRACGADIEYWGIDPWLLGKETIPFDGAHIITGRSEQSFHLVPDDFDLILVDGNHVRNAVILDVFNYSSKVVAGGFMVFHDTGKDIQGKDFSGYCVPDCPNIPEFCTSVLAAFDLIGWPWEPWTLFAETDESAHGCRSYRNGP